MNVSCQKLDYEASKAIVLGLDALISKTGCVKAGAPVSIFTVEEPMSSTGI